MRKCVKSAAGFWTRGPCHWPVSGDNSPPQPNFHFLSEQVTLKRPTGYPLFCSIERIPERTSWAAPSLLYVHGTVQSAIVIHGIQNNGTPSEASAEVKCSRENSSLLLFMCFLSVLSFTAVNKACDYWEGPFSPNLTWKNI